MFPTRILELEYQLGGLEFKFQRFGGRGLMRKRRTTSYVVTEAH
jgi:hypothetical protein